MRKAVQRRKAGTDADAGASWRALWDLDPNIVFLNHGSFGACPRTVLEYQQELRQQMEREPIRFMMRELEPLLDRSREKLAAFVGCTPESLAWISNATSGINAVLRSHRFESGQELLTTSHVYNACGNALEYVARREGASVVVVDLPFPLNSEDEIVERLVSAVTDRTRLALVDHVTSATGLVFPVQRIVSELKKRGVDTLIDGAHAPGMVDVDLRKLDPTYYVANCHKWLCAPKGAAFLYVSPEKQKDIRPLVISHGANSTRTDRSRFQLEFDWQGTMDYTPAVCVEIALDCLGSLLPGGWPQLRSHNRDMVLRGRRILTTALGWTAPCPERMIGSLATLTIPEAELPSKIREEGFNALHDVLFDEFKVEVMVCEFPPGSRQLGVRISGMLYNEREDYVRLADALGEIRERDTRSGARLSRS